MNVVRILSRALRLYFWVLVAGVILGGLWVTNTYLIDLGLEATGLYAVGGFIIVVLAFMITINRFAR